jgi:hypothetical protein
MMDLTDLPEVVQDFQEALEDLHENSKPAIDVLTVIAKENTDHAGYISAVLERHIRTVLRNFKSKGASHTNVKPRLDQNGDYQHYLSWIH